MSITYISAELRRLVMERAEGLREYCLLDEEDSLVGHQVDHIIGEKQCGPTTSENMAYACAFCNRYKGSDVGSIVPGTTQFVRFYNPRLDRWSDHFALHQDGVTIRTLTDSGEATARIFAFNSDNRIQERQVLRQAGRYPVETARRIMDGNI